MPRYISKFGRPLPYFMKYRSPYYARQKLSMAKSNMNRLCFELERWERSLRWRRGNTFDHSIMMNPDVTYSQEEYDAIEPIYLKFCAEMADLNEFVRSNYGKPIESSSGLIVKPGVTFEIDYHYYYERYKEMCRQVCTDQRKLANICVDLTYVKYQRKNKTFGWIVAEQGILENIRTGKVSLPERVSDGDYDYLGRKYTIREIIQ